MVHTVNTTIFANDSFNINKMSSEIISVPINTTHTDLGDSSFFTGVFHDSKKYDIEKPILKTGPLDNT